MEKVSTELELAELSNQNFRRNLDQLHDRASSILLLTLQWKDVENHFESNKNAAEKRAKELYATEESIKERSKELKAREEQLRVSQETLEAKEKELNVIQESYKEKLKEVEKREKEFDLKQIIEIKKRREEIERIEKSSKQLKFAQKYADKKLQEVEVQEKNVVSIKSSTENRSKELELNEKRLEECIKTFELKEKQLGESCRELEAKMKEHEKLMGEAKAKERQFNEYFEEHGRRFELRSKDLELKYEQQSKELELKAKKLEERSKELELKEKQIEETFKELGLKDKKLEELCKEVELKGKQIEVKFKEVELKEKKLASTQHPTLKVEPPDNLVHNNAIDHSSSPDIQFCVIMDGKSLQMYLNEHWRDHDSMGNEVALAFQLSSDPAKLVLDAMEGFYPPHLKKDGREFEESVARRSCILLLEQLMKIKPQIKPLVKNGAMKLSFDWLTKVRVNVEHSLEVLGFLLVLASFGLASSFDAAELFNLLVNIGPYDQAPELLQDIGLANKISGVIQNLIGRKKHLEAIRFIYAFEKIHEFPPIPLLNDYLKCSREAARLIYARGNKTPEAQEEAKKKKIADLRVVIRCIENNKRESDFPVKDLKNQIASLEKQPAKRKLTTPTLVRKDKPISPGTKKLKSPTIAAAAPTIAPASASISEPTVIPAFTTAPAPKTPFAQQSGSKRPRPTESAEAATYFLVDSTTSSVQKPSQKPTGLSTNQGSCSVPSQVKTDQSPENLQLKSTVPSSCLRPQAELNVPSVTINGRGLRLLLIKHNNHDLVRSEVSDAVRSALDPAKLVLETVNGAYPSNLEGNKDFKLGVSTDSCFLLLEQLRIVLPQIEPLVKDEARKFTFAWKSKLLKKRENRLEVICFLQFLAIYKLTSIFRADELLCLLDTDYWRKKSPRLFQFLGLADEIPNFIENLIKQGQQLKAIKYIYALDVVEKFPPVPLLNDHLRYSKKTAERLCKSANKRITAQELAALKAVVRCIAEYKLESKFPPSTLEDRIVQLEKQKAEKKLQFDNPKAKTGSGITAPAPASYGSSLHVPASTTASSKPVPAPASVITPSTTAASTTGTARNFQPVQQTSGNKRPRVAEPLRYYSLVGFAPVTSHRSTEPARHYSLAGFPPVTSHRSTEPARHYSLVGFPRVASHTSAEPARHYSLAGFPPMTSHTSFYHNNVMPAGYSLNPLRRSYEHDSSMHIAGTRNAPPSPQPGFHYPPILYGGHNFRH